jgi:hypothetical protein
MASLKKVCKTKRGMRNARILQKRHVKSRKFSEIQKKQVELVESLLPEAKR